MAEKLELRKASVEMCGLSQPMGLTCDPVEDATALPTSAALSPCVLRLYLARYSASCLGPWIMLRWLQKHQGIRFELVDVDIANAEHVSATFFGSQPKPHCAFAGGPMQLFGAYGRLRDPCHHAVLGATLRCVWASGPRCWGQAFVGHWSSVSGAFTLRWGRSRIQPWASRKTSKMSSRGSSCLIPRCATSRSLF